jgi:hypothetical protein
MPTARWSFSLSLSGLLLSYILISGKAFAQPQADSSSVRSESQRMGINTFTSGNAGDWRKKFSGDQRIHIMAGQYWVYNRALPSNRFIINNLWSGKWLLRHGNTLILPTKPAWHRVWVS